MMATKMKPKSKESLIKGFRVESSGQDSSTSLPPAFLGSSQNALFAAQHIPFKMLNAGAALALIGGTIASGGGAIRNIGSS
jgi:hypothetical protein